MKAKWISINDERPVMGERVLLYHHEQGIQIGYLNVNRIFVLHSYAEAFGSGVTHWQPLPAIPNINKKHA